MKTAKNIKERPKGCECPAFTIDNINELMIPHCVVEYVQTTYIKCTCE